MASPLAFISYRRSDVEQAALGLQYQLRARLGIDSLFMDRLGIRAGEQWPQRLRDAMKRSTVVLALIGPGWLKAADKHGRRRLDLPDDWVRTELETALKTRTPIIQVLMGSAVERPEEEALPPSLVRLCKSQDHALHEDSWDAGLDALVRLLVDNYGFQKEPKVPAPDRVVTPKPLTAAKLEQVLKTLPGWEQVESLIPGDYPKTRHEIRKTFVFQTFQQAMDFMASAIPDILKLQHHPRWENQWRSVTVYLSTWDIESQISHLDTKLAAKLDDLYRKAKRQ